MPPLNLAGRGRTDAPVVPQAPAARPISRREADALVSAELLEAVRAQAATNTAVLAALKGAQLTNGILDSLTATLDASGLWSRDWGVAAGSAAVTNHGSADVYVSAGPTAQTSGRGATRIRAGGSAVVYLSSTTMTVSGAPGTGVTVVAFTGVQPPAWASAGSSGGAVTFPTGATSNLSSTADSTTSAVLLAANAARVGASVYNDSTAVLYLALGLVASSTAYTTQVPAGGLYELPSGYTGPVAGVWASDSTGAARVTEILP